MPSALQPTTSSAITLDEGQLTVKATAVKAVQDPSPVAHTVDARSNAYERDVQLLKMR